MVGDGGKFILRIAAGEVVIREDIFGLNGREVSGVPVFTRYKFGPRPCVMTDACRGYNSVAIDVALSFDLGPAVVGEAAIEVGARDAGFTELLCGGEASTVLGEHIVGCGDPISGKQDQRGVGHARKSGADSFLVEAHCYNRKDHKQGQEVSVEDKAGEYPEGKKSTVRKGERPKKKQHLSQRDF